MSQLETDDTPIYTTLTRVSTVHPYCSILRVLRLKKNIHFSNFESKFTKMHGLTPLHFSNFESKFTKMHGLTPLHFSNFESKFTKMHGLTPLHFSNFDSKLKICID